MTAKKIEKAKKKFSTHPYKNKLHILLALICNSYYDYDQICYRSIFISASADDITFVKDIHTEPCSPIYKTLACKRLYPISKNIGCFQLTRNKPGFPDYNKILWQHWEYFASFSPLWYERLKIYKIKKNDKTYKILFKDDDELEEFYEKYGYEPDEQSKETQEKSICEIPPLIYKKLVYGYIW